jgi:alpha-L-fucosidase
MKDRIKRWQSWKIGSFIHFGPYAVYGRGEQVLFREHLDQNEYADAAMQWEAPLFDAEKWAAIFAEGGSKYAVMTTRHHDGFCLWDTKTTNYCSTQSAAKKDFIGEYVKAMRKFGINPGLYYSIADWRIPGYFAGPERDTAGFKQFVEYVHEQVREILANYGNDIGVIWFDGPWHCSAADIKAEKLVNMIRGLQPDIMINPRIGHQISSGVKVAAGEDIQPEDDPEEWADFCTSEKKLIPNSKPWEAEQVTTRRWWGYHKGERWKDPIEIIENMFQTISLGGNYLLNVGPKADGSLPKEYIKIMKYIGSWLKINGEAVYDCNCGGRSGTISEFSTLGYQTIKDNSLYLILRLYSGEKEFTFTGINTKAVSASLLGSDVKLSVKQKAERITIGNIPKLLPFDFAPVVKVNFESAPKPGGIYKFRLWDGDPCRMIPWASSRKTGKKITDYCGGR